MEIRLALRLLIAATFSIGLIACSKVEYDYKALGFADQTEMEAAFAKGYHTKQKLLEMTPKVVNAPTEPQVASSEPTAASASPQVATTEPTAQNATSQVVATEHTTPVKSELKATAEDGPFAPSFDCLKAISGPERLICSDRDLSKLDVELNQIFIKVRATTPDKNKFKSEQLAWMQSSRNACADKPCMLIALNQRIAELSK